MYQVFEPRPLLPFWLKVCEAVVQNFLVFTPLSGAKLFVPPFRVSARGFMDALTLVLAGFLDDDTIVAFSRTCGVNLHVVEAYREVALARALLRLLALLTQHQGANTIREWQEQDQAEETVWFLNSVVPDWDLSD